MKPKITHLRAVVPEGYTEKGFRDYIKVAAAGRGQTVQEYVSVIITTDLHDNVKPPKQERGK